MDFLLREFLHLRKRMNLNYENIYNYFTELFFNIL